MNTEWDEEGYLGSTFQHIYPVNDLREHEMSIQCWCHPVVDMDDLIIHNAADGREAYETGLRKTS